jgi:asparagine synthase (glutamine-hydrolysing)
MCGIAGLYNFGDRAPVDQGLLRRMTDIIAHRGPDDAGHFVDGHVGLGHRRLSIIDLSPSGRQPMGNAAGDVWITYNGECYNYAELRRSLRASGSVFRSHSDTEVLLHLYEKQGIDFLRKIDGMYALAIWDARHERLLLARDRLGIKPLFYHYDGSRLLFASELKALLADPGLQCRVDNNALGNFFRFMSIPDPTQTIFRGINKLAPGHYLAVEQGRLSVREYWDIEEGVADEHANIDVTVEHFRRVFEDAVRSHMVADVPVGAFLSGGVDSSSVVAMAARETDVPLRTFAMSFGGLAGFDEAEHARRVAALHQTKHEMFEMKPDLVGALPQVVWHGDEPSGVSSALGVYFLAQAARRHVKVVLTGDGGDEVFAGYPWRHQSSVQLPRSIVKGAQNFTRLWSAGLSRGRSRRRLNKAMSSIFATPGNRYSMGLSLYARGELAELVSPEVFEAVYGSAQDSIEYYYDKLHNAGELNRKLYADIKTTLVSEMLTKVDRMTMAFGLEARVPFLDWRLVQWAFSLPDSHKLRAGQGKYIVKRAMASALPADILYRPKQGFNIPLRRWMTKELAQFISDILRSTRFRQRGLVKPGAVDVLLARLFESDENCSNHLFELVSLELWFQRYVDRRHDIVGAPSASAR